VKLPSAPYDIVWMGSLVTHLDRTTEQQLWELLRRVLRPDALVVLSTLGRAGVAMLDEFVPNGGAHAEAVDADLTATGRAYVPYPHYRRTSYGMALHTADYLDQVVRREVAPDARRVAFEPAAWLGVQDVHVFQFGAESG
jgi:hypothetical protein